MARIKAMIDGRWYGDLVETPALARRLAAAPGFHRWVTPDGASGLAAEPGRYHLYVSYACPWAHRTILYRKLLGLEPVISMSVLHPRWAGPDGWTFGDTDMSTVDHPGGRRHLHEVYRHARPDYTGRVTVPVLWDRRDETIVNNQSGEIMRMLGTAFAAYATPGVDFYPVALREAIDAMNALVLASVSTGVYRAGFARSQGAYDRAVRELFAALDRLEAHLARHPFLVGERVTESDWHLFCTLCRFDAAYHGALRCNLRRLVDYPSLARHTRRLHEFPGVSETVRFDHVKRHYHDAIGEIDPAIVPAGPATDYRDLAPARQAA